MFVRFSIMAKSIYYLSHVCLSLSVCLHVSALLQHNFNEIWYWELLWKGVENFFFSNWPKISEILHEAGVWFVITAATNVLQRHFSCNTSYILLLTMTTQQYAEKTSLPFCSNNG